MFFFLGLGLERTGFALIAAVWFALGLAALLFAWLIAILAGTGFTFPPGNQIRVVKIVELGTRRGPPREAQTLYENLSPPEGKNPQEQSQRGGARPTQKDRRRL